MRFEISRASGPLWSQPQPISGAEKVVREDGDWDWFIEVASLEDLMVLIKLCGQSIVIDTEAIIIYDDWIE